MAKISNNQIKDVYYKFKDFYKTNKNNLSDLQQSSEVNNIKLKILSENKYDWNETSLANYINSLFYIIKGIKFKRTINAFAEKFFIDQICSDFPEKCEDAKESLRLHKKYYANVTKKNKQGNTENMSLENNKQPLNQILYGPPGTGKTYKTISRAVEIIENRMIDEKEEKRNKIKEKFKKYKENGQIEFITFHQNYAYEEFIEGIKATTENDEIRYSIEAGIFKKLCERASNKSNFDDKIEWLKSQCSESEGKSIKIKNFTLTYRNGITFRVKLDKSKTDKDYPASIENIKRIYNGTSRKEVYNPTYVIAILDYLYENGLTKSDKLSNKKNDKNYVLIIDEINRGNISKIFGEIITLIEEDKRIGNDEETTVKLPYSGIDGEEFGVPKNLYIIGTMNTADRSISLMDTALRRRFQFEEMMPDYSELSKKIISKINLGSLLETINKRIEYLYDRDHTIGHSYFIKVKDKEDLDNVFKTKIIPLLQEYFYEDWEKIQMVLGDHPSQNAKEDKFIIEENLKEKAYFGSDHDDVEDEKKTYSMKTEFTKEAYLKIAPSEKSDKSNEKK